MTDWPVVLDAPRLGIALGGPATNDSIRECEAKLGVPLPRDLAELLRFADGFHDVGGQWDCAWSATRIASENLSLWGSDLLDRQFLAFGHNGSDTEFCMDLASPDQAQVVEWSAIDGEPGGRWPSLAQFWIEWLRPA